ncbi:MAG TPA: acetoacetate--CoA ligase [Solirubrobacteraceae bacterium]|jgi:acetoacetyl-CoA synthetase|nr:acetoacetate--CoA ligase [Solirubrobacteraceae bacterium]
MGGADMQAPLWEPSSRARERATMTRFMRWVAEREGRAGGFVDYEELRRWSVDELERFWAAIWEFCGVRASRPYERVLASRAMPGARWFAGAELNYAENMLCDRGSVAGGGPEGSSGASAPDRSGAIAVVHASDRSRETPAVGRHPRFDRSGETLACDRSGETLASGEHPPFSQHPRFDRSRETPAVGRHPRFGQRDPNAIAVLHASELRPLAELTWGELSAQVAAVAGGLRALGVGRGDRVVAYMPNIPETLIAFLASASLGAIFSSAAPEFGARSVIDRFAQIEPTVLLAVDGYRHGGKDFDRRAMVGEILAELPTVRHAVLLPYLLEGEREVPAGWPGGLTWGELCERGAGYELVFEQVPFDHPLWVLYSSGTTGLPKAIVHGHGGILVEQLKKSYLHLDLQRGDRMFWFTTTGWMMWNFLIGCLFTEAAIVLYDGSPGHPDMGAMWALAERTGMTCMGVSAGLLSASEKAGVKPGRDYDLSALRSIGSTGSPLAPEGFAWVYRDVKPDVWLFSTSGGTDVCTAFVGGCPLLPVYEGELQCRVLGCAVEAWDEQGRSLLDEVGELVLREPLPSMPLFFWEDPPAHDPPTGSPTDRLANPPVGERYRESYFSMYPGVWRHGDWIRITPRGGAVIYGRSDATINRQGVRMGTSEIYRAACAMGEVVDALVVDIPRGPADGEPGGELQMWLFVVLAPEIELDEELVGRIKRRIREDCSPRHVPNEVLQIEEVPRTLSGKILEVPVKRILMGMPAGEAASVDSLANPRALDYFVELARRLKR